MKLTLHTDYALRILLYLGTHPEETVTTGQIAESYGISSHHLLKVTYRLGNLGLVDVTRGKGGGLKLRLAPSEIRVGQVVEAFEADLNLVECFDQETNQCVISPSCRLKGILHEAMQAFIDSLNQFTLDDLLKSKRKALRTLLHSQKG